jgi:exodeoxyribonuclease VII large subunit
LTINPKQGILSRRNAATKGVKPRTIGIMSQLSLFESNYWSVTQLTHYLRDLLENDANLQDVWVQGEVSNFSRPSSGHLYFTLKDSTSALRVVMWRSIASRLALLPRDGDALEVHGAIGVYEAGGQYQLYADTLRPVGEGALFQEFLRLKARLEAEGLFDPERKRPIPHWPQRIGIVTSPTGAALRDMINTLQRRYPLPQIILAPTAVQGVDAPAGIVQALESLNQRYQPDVILLARGGGSIEDLWAFNDERVARAIAASTVPVISGVGHETDFTIADFVSDLRAPTPTAAAELATPNRVDLLENLGELKERAERALQTVLNDQRWRLNRLESTLTLRSPLGKLRSDRQWLDELERRSISALDHQLQLQRSRQQGLEQRLGSLNPSAVLARGYAVVMTTDGDRVRSTRQVASGDDLDVHVQDGRFGVRVRTKPESESGHAG